MKYMQIDESTDIEKIFNEKDDKVILQGIRKDKLFFKLLKEHPNFIYIRPTACQEEIDFLTRKYYNKFSWKGVIKNENKN